MDFLYDVAGLIDAGKSIAQAKFHMAEEGVLRHVEAHPGRRRITRANLYIDIAHRRIESAGIGIAHDLVARNDGGHRHGHVADAILIAAAKHDHRRHTLLETGGSGPQQDDGPRRPHAIDAHAGRHDERAGDAVGARRQEDHAVAGLVTRAVERLLDRVAVIRPTVALARDGDGGWLLGRGGKNRRFGGMCRVHACHRGCGQQRRHDVASDHHRLSQISLHPRTRSKGAWRLGHLRQRS